MIILLLCPLHVPSVVLPSACTGDHVTAAQQRSSQLSFRIVLARGTDILAYLRGLGDPYLPAGHPRPILFLQSLSMSIF